ncbi:PREDICTED: uncharacterized protein LOC104612807 [Nelumbo nucifera]|uniref:Uncharacterized protein LOC104612807 n=2 Tax=Nelumbo nucifera TaxID=4432 RepID=A0A1U8BNP2_NELNU|nr:PREDICTED: uncharacterized protein LOC104612807 [Nelumbo nucifera]DAD35831.1 TPA_asm: hypothetical protein HUJ06_006471 [Nelumbo nucifera]
MVGLTIRLKKKKPEWLELLLKSKFFGPCFDHQDLKKNEMNVYCVNCNQCVCQHCLSSSAHYLHVLLQIRRYVYNDVVRLHDMQKHLDCSKVQPYTINGAKVVFLNPRPQSKPSKSTSGVSCLACERGLTEPNCFCSIACKVSISMAKQNSRRDQSPPYLTFPIPEFSDLSAKQNQNLEPNLKEDESSNLTTESSEENNHQISWFNSALKPMRQLHKRKSTPRRAPLF